MLQGATGPRQASLRRGPSHLSRASLAAASFSSDSDANASEQEGGEAYTPLSLPSTPRHRGRLLDGEAARTRGLLEQAAHLLSTSNHVSGLQAPAPAPAPVSMPEYAHPLSMGQEPIDAGTLLLQQLLGTASQQSAGQLSNSHEQMAAAGFFQRNTSASRDFDERLAAKQRFELSALSASVPSLSVDTYFGGNDGGDAAASPSIATDGLICAAAAMASPSAPSHAVDFTGFSHQRGLPTGEALLTRDGPLGSPKLSAAMAVNRTWPHDAPLQAVYESSGEAAIDYNFSGMPSALEHRSATPPQYLYASPNDSGSGGSSTAEGDSQISYVSASAHSHLSGVNMLGQPISAGDTGVLTGDEGLLDLSAFGGLVPAESGTGALDQRPDGITEAGTEEEDDDEAPTSLVFTFSSHAQPGPASAAVKREHDDEDDYTTGESDDDEEEDGDNAGAAAGARRPSGRRRLRSGRSASGASEGGSSLTSAESEATSADADSPRRSDSVPASPEPSSLGLSPLHAPFSRSPRAGAMAVPQPCPVAPPRGRSMRGPSADVAATIAEAATEDERDDDEEGGNRGGSDSGAGSDAESPTAGSAAGGRSVTVTHSLSVPVGPQPRYNAYAFRANPQPAMTGGARYHGGYGATAFNPFFSGTVNGLAVSGTSPMGGFGSGSGPALVPPPTRMRVDSFGLQLEVPRHASLGFSFELAHSAPAEGVPMPAPMQAGAQGSPGQLQGSALTGSPGGGGWPQPSSGQLTALPPAAINNSPSYSPLPPPQAPVSHLPSGPSVSVSSSRAGVMTQFEQLAASGLLPPTQRQQYQPQSYASSPGPLNQHQHHYQAPLAGGPVGLGMSNAVGSPRNDASTTPAALSPPLPVRAPPALSDAHRRRIADAIHAALVECTGAPVARVLDEVVQLCATMRAALQPEGVEGERVD